ncbi:hypothetical protein HY30_17360 [Hyphomonas chukchiensis]|uniref:Peptidase S9 prolyl oligopeptidase catalytic domain-containing protein n=1 Tax=Hyphomonas chukchiensis TaxID=1280947 RepID=A0A062UNM3_9PROT|nr:hypothetical protein HY30_17360 [Hyphomonas chukchiensis]
MRLGLIFVVLLVLLGSGPAAVAEHKGVSVDDMMKVEGLGSALIDPAGRWLVYERLRPYDQIPDYSFRTYAFGKSGHQLWRYDLARGGEPHPLPGIDPEPHAWLGGFSPSGRFLTVMQYRFGDLSIAAYDMQGEASVTFEQAPAFSRTGEYGPVWISGTELVFAALPAGQQPLATSVRALTGKRLSSAWQAAWTNSGPTADEVRTVPRDGPGGPAPGQLVRADAMSGKTTVLADGLYADLRLSADGRMLAALGVSQPDPADPAALVETDRRHYTLTVFDLTSGLPKLLAPGLEFMPYTITWDPGGHRLAAFGWERGGDPRSGRFHVVDLSTGRVTRYDHDGLDLVSERERGWLQRPERTVFLGDDLALFAREIPESEDQAPRFTYQDIRPDHLPAPDWYRLSADGRHANLTRGLADVSGVPVHAGEGHLTVWAQDGVYRLGETGARRRLSAGVSGRFRFLAPGTFTARRGVARPEFADEAMFTVRQDGGSQIVMLDLRKGEEGKSVSIRAPAADALPLAGSLMAGSVVFEAADGPVTRLLAGRTGSHDPPEEITRLNSHLEGVDFGTWKRVAYDVADPEGLLPPQPLESCLLLPPGTDSSAPLPLIVDVYPGSAGICPGAGQKIAYPDPHSPYLWAGQGYAYARVATPTGLIRTPEGPIAGLPAVIDAGVEAIIGTGLVDPERIALHGFSQGAVSALFVAAHSNRYKAVIAKNGWADLFSHYFGGSGVYAYFYGDFGSYLGYDSVAGSDFGIGRTPFEDPDMYYRNSPVFLAPDIDTPVLLMHSDLDSFDMAQFDEMFGALQRAGKDARYVRYWGEGHGPSSPANIRDMWARMGSFLAEHGVAPDE